MGRLTRRLGAAVVVTVLVAGGVTLLEHALARPAHDEPLKPHPDLDDGRRLYQRDCVYCHGPVGGGTTQGPPINLKGTAAVHYMVSTGRMPIQDPDQPIRRREAAYTEDEIDALIGYVDGFVSGPSVPEVHTSRDRLSRGSRVFQLNCAACHQLVGTGGVLVGREAAPGLHLPTATQVGDAVRAGPGEMPAFSTEEIPREDLDALASYVTLELQDPTDRGGLSLGHFGPFSEGFAAWFLGIGTLLGVSLWIGRRT